MVVNSTAEALGTVSGVSLLLGSSSGTDEILNFAAARRCSKLTAIPWAGVAAVAEMLHSKSDHNIPRISQCLDIAEALASSCARQSKQATRTSAQDVQSTLSRSETSVNIACLAHFVSGVLLQYSPLLSTADGQKSKPNNNGRGKQQAQEQRSCAKNMTPIQCKKLVAAFVSSFTQLFPFYERDYGFGVDLELDTCMVLAVQVWNLCTKATDGSPEAGTCANAFLPTLAAAVDCFTDEKPSAFWVHPGAATALWSLLLGQHQHMLGLLLSTLAVNSTNSSHSSEIMSNACCYLRNALTKAIGLSSSGSARSSQPDTQLALAILKQVSGCNAGKAVFAITTPTVLAGCLSKAAVATRKAALCCIDKQLSCLLSTVSQDPVQTMKHGQKLALVPTASSLAKLSVGSVLSSTAHMNSRPTGALHHEVEQGQDAQAWKSLRTILWLCDQQLQCLTSDKDATCRRRACIAVACHATGLLHFLEDANFDQHEELLSYFVSLTASLCLTAKDSSKMVRAEVLKAFSHVCSAADKTFFRAMRLPHEVSKVHEKTTVLHLDQIRIWGGLIRHACGSHAYYWQVICLKPTRSYPSSNIAQAQALQLDCMPLEDQPSLNMPRLTPL
jgi:hypothetical protein